MNFSGVKGKKCICEAGKEREREGEKREGEKREGEREEGVREREGGRLNFKGLSVG